ncbi:MAG: hypothetical protein Faunusvirus4_20 [Faunusvirus sp.]|uniref:Uncharacterized protein n=1 Tax=Faunusvirus sp. TaxID=2487766 RepID=A0A3G5A115_9VIRU|nr:MAG: hypothetical protein Faunusvirus4_20 [Faunusvirus sp.]
MNKYCIADLPKYVHISNNPIETIKFTPQGLSFKPTGFWFAERFGWIDFIHDNFEDSGIIKLTPTCFSISNNSYLYGVTIPTANRITVTDKSNKNKILLINTVDDLVTFTKKFHYTAPRDKHGKKRWYINWKQVGNKYGGIIIPTFKKLNEQLRKKNSHDVYDKKYLWFYTIDVSGGCIWNSNIATIKLLNPSK